MQGIHSCYDKKLYMKNDLYASVFVESLMFVVRCVEEVWACGRGGGSGLKVFFLLTSTVAAKWLDSL